MGVKSATGLVILQLVPCVRSAAGASAESRGWPNGRDERPFEIMIWYALPALETGILAGPMEPALARSRRRIARLGL